MNFTNYQLKEALEIHLQQTSKTLFELSDRLQIDHKALFQFYHHNKNQLTEAEHHRLQAYFGNTEEWVIWQTKEYQKIQSFCASLSKTKSSGILISPKGTGKTTAIKDYCFFHPKALYIDLNKPEDSNLIAQTKWEKEDKFELLILDHIAETSKKSALPRSIPMLLVLEKEQYLSGAYSIWDEINEDEQYRTMRLGGIPKSTILRIASFYSIAHEADIQWLKQRSPTYAALRENILELTRPQAQSETIVENTYNIFDLE